MGVAVGVGVDDGFGVGTEDGFDVGAAEGFALDEVLGVLVGAIDGVGVFVGNGVFTRGVDVDDGFGDGLVVTLCQKTSFANFFISLSSHT